MNHKRRPSIKIMRKEHRKRTYKENDYDNDNDHDHDDYIHWGRSRPTASPYRVNAFCAFYQLGNVLVVVAYVLVYRCCFFFVFSPFSHFFSVLIFNSVSCSLFSRLRLFNVSKCILYIYIIHYSCAYVYSTSSSCMSIRQLFIWCSYYFAPLWRGRCNQGECHSI